ncbi:MAG: hydroxysqualene dehydroxylase HpnE [Planctomycetaceae bacterium]
MTNSSAPLTATPGFPTSVTPPAADSVIVIGGGLAGLACAAALGERGCRVVLLESRLRLGGRASSFYDSESGEWLDNCQHVSLGCCTNFARFCEQMGISQFIAREPRLTFIGPRGTRHDFSSSALPAPLHLAASFAGLSYLGWSDRVSLARGLRKLARTPSAQLRGVAFDRWLADAGQTPGAIENFWHVVLVSALSETVDRLDAAHARKVFVDAFLSHRAGWEVWLPTVPLDRLYGAELQESLRARGVELRLNAAVQRVQADGKGVEVQLRNQERLAAQRVVLAVPAHRVPRLVPQFESWWQEAAGPGRLETAPISSVHLWYDQPLTSDRHVTLVGKTSQWLFNRDQVQPGARTPDGTWYGQVVISASHDVVSRPTAETVATVVAELAAAFPKSPARLVRSRLVTEHRAVLAVCPGHDAYRPGPVTRVPGLFLAGDWIDTGWPSTMEGAVRSGWLAAEAVLRERGTPAELIAPNLPTARLSKWLLGL